MARTVQSAAIASAGSGDLEAIASWERATLFHAGDGLAALRDGVVDAEEITLDLPAE